MVFRCGCFPHPLSLLMPTFALHCAPPRLTTRLQGAGYAPLPIISYPTASAAAFMPAHHPRPPARPVSCYALLGRMAASKPTSRLSLQADLVIPTQAALGGLGRWSGFFPSRDRTLAPCPSLPGMNTAAFGVWPGSAGGEAPSPVQYLYLRGARPEAAPKGISGSTSYLPA